jgi:nitrous oxidase accessory protein
MRSGLIILFICLCIDGFSKKIIVGSDQEIHSLKEAIELAKNNDTIILQKGIYKEGAILLTKSITLIGEGNPVLDGENRYEILLISGKNIVIRGIEFLNAGYSALNDFAAIKLVDASNILLEQNTIKNAYFAIHISNTSYVTVRDNNITGKPRSEQLTGNGIHLGNPIMPRSVIITYRGTGMGSILSL